MLKFGYQITINKHPLKLMKQDKDFYNCLKIKIRNLKRKDLLSVYIIEKRINNQKSM